MYYAPISIMGRVGHHAAQQLGLRVTALRKAIRGRLHRAHILVGCTDAAVDILQKTPFPSASPGVSYVCPELVLAKGPCFLVEWHQNRRCPYQLVVKLDVVPLDTSALLGPELRLGLPFPGVGGEVASELV